MHNRSQHQNTTTKPHPLLACFQQACHHELGITLSDAESTELLATLQAIATALRAFTPPRPLTRACEPTSPSQPATVTNEAKTETSASLPVA